MPPRLTVLPILAAILAAANAAAATLAPTLLTLPEVDKVRVELAEPDKALAAAEDLDATGVYKYAEPIPTLLSPWNDGTWETLADGTRVWRLVVESPGALSINLGFIDYAMPAGGRLYLHTPDRKQVVGPFTSDNNNEHGELWTPMVDGDTAVVEVQVPGAAEGELRLVLGSINHGLRTLGGFLAKSGSCNIDVACADADPWRPQVRSVVAYSTGGSIFCTGVLINNTAQDRRPFILTANHCGITSSNAASMVVYWNYENTTCRTPGSSASGANGNGSLATFNTGATWRASSAASDFTLVELNAPVNSNARAFFAGWDRSGNNAAGVVGIHHPSGEEKRISFSNLTTTTTNYNSNTVSSTGTHFRVISWNRGTTEPGSSGSPLFDLNGRIIGQLHGGGAACGNTLSDWYGRLAVSWTGGGTTASSLRSWLDPLNTNATVLDGLEAEGFTLSGTPAILDAAPGGDGDGQAEPGETFEVRPTLRNSSGAAIGAFAARVTSLTATAIVEQPIAQFPAIPAGGTGAATSGFVIRLLPGHPCGGTVRLSLAIPTQPAPFNLVFTLATAATCNFIPAVEQSGPIIIIDDGANGNNNTHAEPGEELIELVVPLLNRGRAIAETNVTLRLTEPPGVEVHPLGATRLYSQLAGGTTRFPEPDGFRVSIAPTVACQSIVRGRLELDTLPPLTIPIEFQLGAPGTIISELRPGAALGPAPMTINFPITLSEPGVVEAVRVGVTILHTWAADVDLYLRGPDGTRITLFNDVGGSGDNFIDTVLDDTATIAIANGNPPFTGRFRPAQALSAFVGRPIAGTWNFEVVDDADQDGGRIDVLRLEIDVAAGICATNLQPSGIGLVDGDGAPLALEGSVLDFGEVEPSGAPATLRLGVTNPGAGALEILRADIPAPFALVGDAPRLVAPGATEYLTLSFAPEQAGPFTESMTLHTSHATHRVIYVQLTGTGLVTPRQPSTLWAVW